MAITISSDQPNHRSSLGGETISGTNQRWNDQNAQNVTGRRDGISFLFNGPTRSMQRFHQKSLNENFGSN